VEELGEAPAAEEVATWRSRPHRAAGGPVAGRLGTVQRASGRAWCRRTSGRVWAEARLCVGEAPGAGWRARAEASWRRMWAEARRQRAGAEAWRR
jgi:hypothetical protein